MSDCDDTGILQVGSDDLPIYDKSTLPDNAELIMLTEEQNFDYGGLLSVAYRLQLDRVIANNTKQGNIYSLHAPDAGIAIPDLTVVPAYVEAFDPYELKRAQASSGGVSKAQFLIISTDQNVDDNYIVQASGFYTFSEPHNYSIGVQYYLSDSAPGGVTTTPPPGYVQPLFVPIDPTTIRIQIGL